MIRFGSSNLPDGKSIGRVAGWHREEVCFQANGFLLDHTAIVRVKPTEEPQNEFGWDGEVRYSRRERSNKCEILRLHCSNAGIHEWVNGVFHIGAGLVRNLPEEKPLRI